MSRASMLRSLLLLFVPYATGACQAPGDGPSPLAADLVLHNGKVWTGNTSQPRAAGIAARDGRIVAVGADDDVLRLAGPRTRLIDLRQRRVVPGFIDSHVHFLSGGEELLAPDLRSATSEEELARRLGETAARLPPGTWLTSGAWDHENWPGARLPRRETLDRHTPEHPVLVQRLDGHMAVANSFALRVAGITRETPDPAGGQIVRDPESGEATGVLKDTAMNLVSRHVPPPSRAERLERARAALRHAASVGVTGVHDMMGSFASLEVYQELLADGELTVRVTAFTPIAARERWALAEVQRGFGNDLLKVNGVKGFADGSLGSSTALFFEPYRDSPENRGLALSDLSSGGDLEKQVAACAADRLQVAVHAIGDRAIRALLDIYERVEPSARGEHRFRIEHSQHIHPDDIVRFALQNVVASMQPYHAIDDGRWAEKRLGKERCRTTYAFRDLIDAGATLAFGSDWPVAPLSPLLGIYAAASRRTLDGKNRDGWIPEQKISVEESLTAYTRGSAYAAFDEGRLGTLAPGMLADIVVLDTDILDADLEQVRRAKVDLTIVGGRVVHERQP